MPSCVAVMVTSLPDLVTETGPLYTPLMKVTDDGLTVPPKPPLVSVKVVVLVVGPL